MSVQYPLITVLGPTAVGKTAFAAQLASDINAEIISADSRQVYRGMDIGTGKDIDDYKVEGHTIASHLIDIADPGTEYSVYNFQRDFRAAHSSIISKGKTPILCGGTGLYLESVLLGYELVHVPLNEHLRQKLAAESDDALISRLSGLKPMHNTTDVLDRERLIRAIEIEEYKQTLKNDSPVSDFSRTPVFGIRFDRKIIRDRITSRLTQRLHTGMIEEVQGLKQNGLTSEQLKWYGLEYKYVVSYLDGELSYNQMFNLLNTAIHQFAKRQMTWFRRMEKRGIRIAWLEGEDGLECNIQKVKTCLSDSFR